MFTYYTNVLSRKVDRVMGRKIACQINIVPKTVNLSKVFCRNKGVVTNNFGAWALSLEIIQQMTPLLMCKWANEPKRTDLLETSTHFGVWHSVWKWAPTSPRLIDYSGGNRAGNSCIFSGNPIRGSLLNFSLSGIRADSQIPKKWESASLLWPKINETVWTFFEQLTRSSLKMIRF